MSHFFDDPMIRSILMSLVLLSISGCSLLQPRYPYYVRTLRDTAELDLRRHRSQCLPSMDTLYCRKPLSILNRGYVLLWNGYLAPDTANGEQSRINGYRAVHLYDHHGGPYTAGFPQDIADSAIHCDGRYNVFDVPAFGGMPGIRDSIRVTGRFELLSPTPADTIDRGGFTVRWGATPGMTVSITLDALDERSGYREWQVDGGLGYFTVPAADFREYREPGLCLLSIRVWPREVRYVEGRAYLISCLCREDVKLWMK